jgi:hypothetical protein
MGIGQLAELRGRLGVVWSLNLMTSFQVYKFRTSFKIIKMKNKFKFILTYLLILASCCADNSQQASNKSKTNEAQSKNYVFPNRSNKLFFCNEDTTNFNPRFRHKHIAFIQNFISVLQNNDNSMESYYAYMDPFTELENIVFNKLCENNFHNKKKCIALNNSRIGRKNPKSLYLMLIRERIFNSINIESKENPAEIDFVCGKPLEAPQKGSLITEFLNCTYSITDLNNSKIFITLNSIPNENIYIVSINDANWIDIASP